MRFVNIYFFVFLLAVLFSACAKDIVDTTGSITGEIRDSKTGNAISGANVILEPHSGATTTSASGSFSFKDLEAGTYTINASKEGYSSSSISATVVPGQVKQTDLQLVPLIANLSVSPLELNFGDLSTSMELFISTENHIGSISYTITANADWINLSKNNGNVSTQVDRINVVIDRSNISTGNYTKEIIISFPSGSISIPVYVFQVEKSTPKVTIGNTEQISESSFSVGGTLVKTGGAKVLAYGHCWSTKENPTVSDEKSNLGDTETVGTFSSQATNIIPGTKYYIRAYATNSEGTSYSEQISILLNKESIPSVTTKAISGSVESECLLKGEVTDNGGSQIIECGFYFGKDINNLSKNPANTVQSGQFEKSITGLESSTNYYYKAYAINGKGSAEGELKSFVTNSDGKPVVSTLAAEDITITTALLLGSIDNFADIDLITDCGFLYGESQDPSIRIKPTSVPTDGRFSVSLSELKTNTTYYFKAYATNRNGTAYGTTLSFETGSIVKPIVETGNASNIAPNSVELDGLILGGGEIDECGFFYGTTDNPTLSVCMKNEHNNGKINLSLTNLKEGTTYYYKAYAKNSKGYSFGEIKSFTTTISPKIENDSYTLIRYRTRRGTNNQFGNRNDYHTLSAYSDLIANGTSIIKAGFLWCKYTNYVKKESDLMLNKTTCNEIQCEIRNSSISVVDKFLSYAISSQEYYIRPYMVLEDGSVVYGEVTFVYEDKAEFWD